MLSWLLNAVMVVLSVLVAFVEVDELVIVVIC